MTGFLVINKAGSPIGILFVYLLVTFYSGCVDVSMYVYVSEIFPTLIRAQGISFSISGLFVSALCKFISISPKSFSPPIFKPHKTYTTPPQQSRSLH
jgi:hypothetical protein